MTQEFPPTISHLQTDSAYAFAKQLYGKVRTLRDVPVTLIGVIWRALRVILVLLGYQGPMGIPYIVPIHQRLPRLAIAFPSTPMARRVRSNEFQDLLFLLVDVLIVVHLPLIGPANWRR